MASESVAMGPVSTAAQTAASRALFNKHPEDVVCTLAESGKALSNLETLLTVIEEVANADAERAGTMGKAADTTSRRAMERIAALAAMGRHVATDMANIADCESEDMRAALRKGV